MFPTMSCVRGSRPQSIGRITRKAFGRQMLAILSDGSRVERLRRIKAPTLVIHGADDPLVPVAAGEHTAQTIPCAKLKILPGMGHDLPPGLVGTLTGLILDHCRMVEEITRNVA